MTQYEPPQDVLRASVEIAGYLDEVCRPTAQGASMPAILGAAIFLRVLQERGYAVVPTAPSSEMEQAYKQGWNRPFSERYASLLKAADPMRAE